MIPDVALQRTQDGRVRLLAPAPLAAPLEHTPSNGFRTLDRLTELGHHFGFHTSAPMP